jgi:nucleotide-binding universal stress UspA family protein
MKTAISSNKARSGQTAVRSQVQRDSATPFQIRSILVPIDFSKPSLRAIECALPLVNKFGAQLHLVHVFAPEYPFASTAAMPLIVPELEVGKRVRRHLRDLARKYSLRLGHENIHALRGRPFEEICRLARERSIDLIITSTRGLTGLKHLALGSTAERIVRYSPCPVLVLRQFDRNGKTGRNGKITKGQLSFRKILVPIDFSDCSMKGVAYAKSLAGKFGSKLVLLHSVAIQYYVSIDEYARFDFPQLMQQAEKAARNQMGDLVEKADWDGVAEVETSMQIGHAGQQICARAIDHHADVIVTSTHGTTGFKHVLLGSTAEYVVRHASCPVLVVPSHERPQLNSRKETN